jgi:hypothetical protein
MGEKINISDDLRKYFESAKKEYEELRAGPEEFTRKMFQSSMGIKMRVADAELRRRVERGELVVRMGRDTCGMVCNLYKFVKKPPL